MCMSMRSTLIDHVVESAPDHRLFGKAIDQAPTRDVPGPVLAEVDCFLRDERFTCEDLLTLWKDADPEIPRINEARANAGGCRKAHSITLDSVRPGFHGVCDTVLT
jgi:hypothetical protein